MVDGRWPTKQINKRRQNNFKKRKEKQKVKTHLTLFKLNSTYLIPIKE